MAIPVQMSISLRDRRGVVFGTLCRIADRRLELTCETGFRSGQLLEFSFELEGFHTSVNGKAEVERSVDGDSGARVFLCLTELGGGQEALFREWLYNQTQGGGTSSRPHAHLSSVISTTSQTTSDRLAAGERRLRALDERRSSSLTSSFPSSTPSPHRSRIGRKAVRDVLLAHAHAETQPAKSEAPRRKARPARAAVHRGPEYGGSARDRLPRPKKKRRRLEVKVANKAKPPLVMVRFNDPRLYSRQYWRYLCRDALFVPHTQTKPSKEAEIRLRLVLPGVPPLNCPGKVVVSIPTGLGLRLELTEEERVLLRRIAGPAPPSDARQG